MQDQLIPLSTTIIDNDEDRMHGVIDITGGRPVFKVMTIDGQLTPGQWRVETVLDFAEEGRKVLPIVDEWTMINLQEVAAEIRFRMEKIA